MTTSIAAIQADALVMGFTGGVVVAAGDGWLWVRSASGCAHVCEARGPRGPLTVIVDAVPELRHGDEVAIDLRAATWTEAPSLPPPAARNAVAECCVQIAPFTLDDPGMHLAAMGRDVRALTDLIGRGPGLTPTGDDVVCGYLAARFAVDPDGARILGDRVLECVDRTGEPSASLLRVAARTGRIFDAGAVLLGSLLAADRPALAGHVRRLTMLGQSTGRALMSGLVAGLLGAP